jgi:hypothetical protein
LFFAHPLPRAALRLPGATVFRPSGPDGKIPDLDKPNRQVASIPLLNEVSEELLRT